MRNRTLGGLSFSESDKNAVWKKGIPIPGKDPSVERKDSCGARMIYTNHGKTVATGWEIDHIKPKSKGGNDAINNLQPLQWENNRHKADDYPHWQCKHRG